MMKLLVLVLWLGLGYCVNNNINIIQSTIAYIYYSFSLLKVWGKVVRFLSYFGWCCMTYMSAKLVVID